MVERVGYLPGLSDAEVRWERLDFERAGVRLAIDVPALSDDQLLTLAARVRVGARRYLKARSSADIVGVIDRAIARLLDREDPYRRKADLLLPVITGYDAEMVRLGLTEYLKTFRKPQLTRFLAEDFANPGILDDFQPTPKGGYVRAFGPDLLAHVWAGNVPGLPLWSLIAGLLVKAGNIGKVPSAEPLLAGLFARLLVDVDPSLADCLAVVWWRGGSEASERVLFGEADVVLAYGGNASLRDIRDRIPITTRFLAHGHKISFALVSSAALNARRAGPTAHDVAVDVASYDQQGCYSPQVVFVERGGAVSPREFARYLAHALATFEHKSPRRALTISEASEVAGWRHGEELKALDRPDREVMGNATSPWGVVYMEDGEDLAPSGLNRTVRVAGVNALADVVGRIAPHRAYLQSVGIAATPAELFHLAEVFGREGVTRISALGRMSVLEAGWHHDGRFNLLDLVTITEIEASAEIAAERLAPYVD